MLWAWIACVGIIVGLVILLLTGCDTGARKDLPQENQTLDSSEAQVFLFPDGYPNVAHKCDNTTGIWTNTDRAVWIVYNDPQCGAPAVEGRDPIILDNIPGSSG